MSYDEPGMDEPVTIRIHRTSGDGAPSTMIPTALLDGSIDMPVERRMLIVEALSYMCELPESLREDLATSIRTGTVYR